jgi:trans-aconitate 2-methyltransferase
MSWDPEQYLKFRAERFAPFDDLLALVRPKPGMRVIDLGCGTGELTRRLAAALPDSEVVGVDSSLEMLKKAQAEAGRVVSFRQERIEEVEGEWDLAFSNAAIQWVGNHESLVRRLFSLLAPGGRIAVQVPSNSSHPSQTLIAETAGEEPMRQALKGWVHEWPVLPVARYAEILFEEGASDIIALDKLYPHVLANCEAVVDWVSGTALIPYFERLSTELHSEFLKRYGEKLRVAMPGSPVFFGFKRTLFAGTRPE